MKFVVLLTMPRKPRIFTAGIVSRTRLKTGTPSITAPSNSQRDRRARLPGAVKRRRTQPVPCLRWITCAFARKGRRAECNSPAGRRGSRRAVVFPRHHAARAARRGTFEARRAEARSGRRPVSSGEASIIPG
jgi:hypothetical protein